MDYQQVLDDIADEFIERLLDFLLEQDLQTRVAEALRHELRQQNTLYADFAGTPLTYTTDNMANYKIQYPKRIGKRQRKLSTQFLGYTLRSPSRTT